MASGVLVFGEATEDGRLHPVTPELIGVAQRLGLSPITCALLGSGVEGLAKECIEHGATKVKCGVISATAGSTSLAMRSATGT